jgi:F0F1-type ATP synthase alpha subunit
VQETERQLHEFIRTEHADMRDKLVAEAALTEEIEGMLKKALEAFVARLASKD